jgi:HEAT repeat protein
MGLFSRRKADAWKQEIAKLEQAKNVDALIDRLGDADFNVQWAARDALGRLGDGRAARPLVALYANDSAGTLTDVTEALAKLKGDGIVEALAWGLKHPNPHVRTGACYVVHREGAKRPAWAATGPLALSLLADPEAAVRAQAARAVAAVRPPGAVKALLVALRDADENVRSEAAYALGQLRDPAAVPALIAAAQDPVPLVRGQAVGALGFIEDPRGIPVIRAALHDPHVAVRRWAADALGSDQ